MFKSFIIVTTGKMHDANFSQQESMELLLISLFNCGNQENLEEIVSSLCWVKKFFGSKVYHEVFDEILSAIRENEDLL